MKKIYFFFYIFLSFFVISCNNNKIGEDQSKAFYKLYGNTNNDYGFDVKQTIDKGYIIAGTITNSEKYTNAYLIKTDKFGNELWSRDFGGKNNDYGRCVLLLPGNRYLIFGTFSDTTVRDNPQTDFYMIITDKDGNVLKDKTISYGTYDVGNYAEYTNHDNLILVGSTTGSKGDSSQNKQILVLLTDTAGNVLDSNEKGQINQYDEGMFVKRSSTGKLNVIANTNLNYSNNAGLNILSLMFEDIDNKLLLRDLNTFGTDGEDSCRSVTETADGKFIIVGKTISSGNTSSEILIIKTDKILTNEPIWVKTYGGSRNDEGNSIISIADSNYLIIGSTENSQGKYDAYLLKLNDSGDTLFTKTFGYNEDDEFGRSIIADETGIIFTGSTKFNENSDIMLIRIYNNGKFTPTAP